MPVAVTLMLYAPTVLGASGVNATKDSLEMASHVLVSNQSTTVMTASWLKSLLYPYTLAFITHSFHYRCE